MQVLEPRVAEGLHGVPRRNDGVGLGIDHVAELLHELQAMTLHGDYNSRAERVGRYVREREILTVHWDFRRAIRHICAVTLPPHLVLDEVINVTRRDGHAVGQGRHVQAAPAEGLDQGGDRGQHLGAEAARLEGGRES